MNTLTRLAALALLTSCTGGKSSTVNDSGPGAYVTTGVWTGPGTGGGTGTGTGGGGGPGPSAVDVINDRTYAGLRVQIDYVTGRAPNARVLAMVQAELDRLVNSGHITKPAGVELVLDGEIPPGTPDRAYTFQELDDRLKATKGPNVDGDFLVIHALWTDGRYQPDEAAGGTTLGFAYGGNRFVMLADNVESACDSFLGGPLGAAFDQSLCEVTEATVWMHELGHLFGLVGNGIPMVVDHIDADHGHHDSDEDCLMYWAVEQGTVVQSLASTLGGGPQIKRFDEACLADMMGVQ